MLFRRFSFAPFHNTHNLGLGRRARLALAAALHSAIAGHSQRRLRELFDLHEAPVFARALALLSARLQLDALSMLPLCARLQLWPYLPAEVRRSGLALAPGEAVDKRDKRLAA